MRGESGMLCLLVLIGVTDKGEKYVLAIEDGQRESKASWRELLGDLTRRGMNMPRLAVGYGALGVWAALAELFPKTAAQLCWVHKSSNILNCLTKVMQSRAESALQQIRIAPSRAAAPRAVDVFEHDYGAKYPRAVENLRKDLNELLTFYYFPAEHWVSLRTSDPIESTFSTIRYRTRQSRGCFSRMTILAMVFKLVMGAQKNWRRMKGYGLLSQVELGMEFKDGLPSLPNMPPNFSIGSTCPTIH